MIEYKVIKTYEDLKVFRVSFELANRIYGISKVFPREEKYSLTDQVLRSSRSVASNICEGWAKRKYHNVFIRHLYDAVGSCEETRVWLSMAKACGYLSIDDFESLDSQYGEVGAMLAGLIKKWKTY